MLGGNGPKPDKPDTPFAENMRAVAENRDKASFTEIFDHFAPRLKSYLMRQGCSDTEAEEVTQDAMMTLWHKAHLFDPQKSSLSTWLFRVARNRRIDLQRRDRSKLLDGEDPSLQPPSPEEPGAVMDADQREIRIRDALATLPEEQLQMIQLSFFQNFSHGQIAEETGLPLGTVKSRIRLAFNRLRKLIEDDDKIDMP